MCRHRRRRRFTDSAHSTPYSNAQFAIALLFADFEIPTSRRREKKKETQKMKPAEIEAKSALN